MSLGGGEGSGGLEIWGGRKKGGHAIQEKEAGLCPVS